MENKILRRYHHKIYFPDNITDMCIEFFENIREIGITHHAEQQLKEDRRGIIPLPTREQLISENNTVVEFYEILDNKNKPTEKIQKIVLRLHELSDKYDYSYVLARESFIVSAWCNSKSDDHRLKDSLGEYYCPAHIKEIVVNKIKQRAKHFIKIDCL